MCTLMYRNMTVNLNLIITVSWSSLWCELIVTVTAINIGGIHIPHYHLYFIIKCAIRDKHETFFILAYRKTNFKCFKWGTKHSPNNCQTLHELQHRPAIYASNTSKGSGITYRTLPSYYYSCLFVNLVSFLALNTALHHAKLPPCELSFPPTQVPS